MNRFAPYATVVLRLAVGAVFLQHGVGKLQNGIAGVAGFLHGVGIPFATPTAVYLTTVETLGAACVLLGILTRPWAALMAVDMAVAILAVQVPGGRNFELETLLLAGALALVALGDGPLAVGIRFKKTP
ncbi:MAG: DoxX family protein [Gemmatimonadetes bacterium]|nr:DoxX family protein [Gemmatimonadota bacterium]